MKTAKPEITFRNLRKDEATLMTDYRIEFLKELQGAQSAEKEQMLRKELISYFEKSLSDGIYIAIVAEIKGNPAGFGGMVIQQIPGNFNLISGCEGYILSMYTLPGFRKMGIAGGIVDRLVKKGRELGLGKIYLHASKEGFPIYKKYGFKEPDMPVLEIK